MGIILSANYVPILRNNMAFAGGADGSGQSGKSGAHTMDLNFVDLAQLLAPLIGGMENGFIIEGLH